MSKAPAGGEWRSRCLSPSLTLSSFLIDDFENWRLWFKLNLYKVDGHRPLWPGSCFSSIKCISQIEFVCLFFCIWIHSFWSIIFFSSLFRRANLQSALYFGVYGKGETIVMLDLNWYLRAYSGKIEFSGLLYDSLRYLQGACVSIEGFQAQFSNVSTDLRVWFAFALWIN